MTTIGLIASGNIGSTAARLVSLYVPEGSPWPPVEGRQVTMELLREKLAAAQRYADMDPA